MSHLKTIQRSSIKFTGDPGYDDEVWNEVQLKAIYCASKILGKKGDELFSVMHQWDTQSNSDILETVADFIEIRSTLGATEAEKQFCLRVKNAAMSEEKKTQRILDDGRNQASRSAQNTSSSGSTQNASSSGSTQNASSSRPRAPPANPQQGSTRNPRNQNPGFVNIFKNDYPNTSQG